MICLPTSRDPLPKGDVTAQLGLDQERVGVAGGFFHAEGQAFLRLRTRVLAGVPGHLKTVSYFTSVFLAELGVAFCPLVCPYIKRQ